jgi:large subunit ribosomal protein L10
MFSENPKDPAMILSSFRTASKGDKPVLKAAFINGDIYVGDNQLAALTKIKTKNELIGELIGLLQSPAQRVISALLNKEAASPAAAVAEEAPVVAESVAPATVEAVSEATTDIVAAPEAPSAEAAAPDAPAADEVPAAE